MIWVIGAFFLKAYRVEGPVRQFRLSSILLLMVPLAVYLTYVRCLVRGIDASRAGNIPVIGWILITGYTLVFIIFTTALLLCFTEAVMWLALEVQRGGRRVK